MGMGRKPVAAGSRSMIPVGRAPLRRGCTSWKLPSHERAVGTVRVPLSALLRLGQRTPALRDRVPVGGEPPAARAVGRAPAEADGCSSPGSMTARGGGAPAVRGRQATLPDSYSVWRRRILAGATLESAGP